MKAQKEKGTIQNEIQDLEWDKVKLQQTSAVLDKCVLENIKNLPKARNYCFHSRYRCKQTKMHFTFKFNLGREPVTNKWKLFGKEN